MSSQNVCPICSSPNTESFFEVNNMPVHIGMLFEMKDEALNCPLSNINLVFCNKCSYIWNVDFNPDLISYNGSYDNSLHFSSVYHEYAKSVAEQLIEKYNLYNKKIIEIGSGKGDFLKLLCNNKNYGVGFEPSYDSHVTIDENRIQIIKDYFSEKYSGIEGDLICSRYVFEHIPNPKKFLSMIRKTIGNRSDTNIYFEVPDVLLIIKDLSIWDIIYEHCSYFNSFSLQYVFEICGFKINNVDRKYDGQFISIEASPINQSLKVDMSNKNQFIDEISELIVNFANNYRDKLTRWNNELIQFVKNNKKVVLWGGGAKGTSFLNMLKIKDQIEYVVDINPGKSGNYIPGTAQKIVLPEFLKTYEPDVIIITNEIYRDEIQKKVSDMGLYSSIFSY